MEVDVRDRRGGGGRGLENALCSDGIDLMVAEEKIQTVASMDDLISSSQNLRVLDERSLL